MRLITFKNILITSHIIINTLMQFWCCLYFWIEFFFGSRLVIIENKNEQTNGFETFNEQKNENNEEVINT
jgi:hypothetical protein